jgi:hypothetical protein
MAVALQKPQQSQTHRQLPIRDITTTIIITRTYCASRLCLLKPLCVVTEVMDWNKTGARFKPQRAEIPGPGRPQVVCRQGWTSLGCVLWCCCEDSSRHNHHSSFLDRLPCCQRAFLSQLPFYYVESGSAHQIFAQVPMTRRQYRAGRQTPKAALLGIPASRAPHRKCLKVRTGLLQPHQCIQTPPRQFAADSSWSAICQLSCTACHDTVHAACR